MNIPTFFSETALSFWQHFFVQAVFLLALLAFGFVGVRLLVKKIIVLMSNRSSQEDQEALKKRAQTLVSLLTNAGYVIILLVVGMMLLNAFGVDIRPLLAGAGILGFAVGFGSQSLVKDLIAGVFIIVENQFSVGDEVILGTYKGKVLKITVRSTMLESEEGNIVYLRNGNIASIENMTKKVEDV